MKLFTENKRGVSEAVGDAMQEQVEPLPGGQVRSRPCPFRALQHLILLTGLHVGNPHGVDRVPTFSSDLAVPCILSQVLLAGARGENSSGHVREQSVYTK